MGGRWTVNSAEGSVMREEVVQYKRLILLLFRGNDYVDLQAGKSRTVDGK